MTEQQQMLNVLAAVLRLRDDEARNRPFDGRVPVTQKQLDASDYIAMVEAVLEGNLTHGPYAKQFEADLASQFGLREAVFCNSGSSANLLALATLADASLGEKRLKPGDRVVTCAAGFPTTLNPIIQLGLTPVLVDCELGTYLPKEDQVIAAAKDARAVLIAHTLGNPFPMRHAANEYGYTWQIEDCCDALDSATDYGIHVGRFGQLATCSFYPAHHITTGEGGAVLTDSPKLAKVARSYRDWGRDCWCEPGRDNTCGKRFEYKWQTDTPSFVATSAAYLGISYDEAKQRCSPHSLPDGYDHKHVFTRVGWNLKATDIQAALGVSQLRKLPRFAEARRRNFRQLYKALEPLQDRLLLPVATPGSSPSWFGFPLTVKPPLERSRVVQHLEANGIATRPIFAGNLARQPAYRGLDIQVIGSLENADRVACDSFYVGVHPGLGEEAMAYVASKLKEACAS